MKPNRSNYEPRDEGTLTVTTRNDAGEPVPTEVAFSLADESVFYIQNDYAGDPREFFFGTKRSQQIQTQSTMNQKTYARLVNWKGQLIDDKQREQLEEQSRIQEKMAGIAGNGGGGGGGGGGIVNFQNFGGFGGSHNRFIGGYAFNRDSSRLAYDETGLAPGSVVNGLAFAPATQAMEPINAPPAPTAGIPVMGDLFRAKVRYGAEQEPSQNEHRNIVVRSDFRSTVFWQPDVMTDKNGTATVKVTYPDSLTSWRATARAVTTANQFGIAKRPRARGNRSSSALKGRAFLLLATQSQFRRSSTTTPTNHSKRKSPWMPTAWRQRRIPALRR